VQTTTAASYLYSTRIGSRLTVFRKSATEWVALHVSGTWRNGSTTSAGYAYTPTEWEDISAPTLTGWVSNASITTCKGRRYGDMLDFVVTVSVTGTPTTATMGFTGLPGGFTPNETKMGWGGATGDYKIVGNTGSVTDDSANAHRICGAFLVGSSGASDGNLYPLHMNTEAVATGAITQAAPWAFASGDQVIVAGSYPVD
jgi:hypothetical protein